MYPCGTTFLRLENKIQNQMRPTAPPRRRQMLHWDIGPQRTESLCARSSGCLLRPPWRLMLTECKFPIKQHLKMVLPWPAWMLESPRELQKIPMPVSDSSPKNSFWLPESGVWSRFGICKISLQILRCNQVREPMLQRQSFFYLSWAGHRKI